MEDFWIDEVEEGWLETDSNWHPSVVPLDINNTILFGKEANWVSVSKEYGVWVLNDWNSKAPVGTIYNKAYVHYSVFGSYDHQYPSDKPYTLILSGGDDYFMMKEYLTKEEALEDLALLKTGTVNVEDAMFIGMECCP
jgi:hypothetical protein